MMYCIEILTSNVKLFLFVDISEYWDLNSYLILIIAANSLLQHLFLYLFPALQDTLKSEKIQTKMKKKKR